MHDKEVHREKACVSDAIMEDERAAMLRLEWLFAAEAESIDRLCCGAAFQVIHRRRVVSRCGDVVATQRMKEKIEAC